MKHLIKKAAVEAFKRVGFKLSRWRDPYQLDLYRRLYDPIALQKRELFYNVGAGSFSHPYWTNIDFISDWYKRVQTGCVIHYDLMSKDEFPIPAESAKVIYTSHTIEHIKESAVKKLFVDAFNALENGGTFRITTDPDAETDYRALVSNDEDWFYWDHWYTKPGTYEHMYIKPATSVSLAERWLHHVATQLSAIDKTPSAIKLSEGEIWNAIEERGFPEVLDYFCGMCEFNPKYPGNHISWWTHEKISDYLRESGFKSIFRSGYNQSSLAILRGSELFDSTHPQMSIYIEAVKR